MWNVRPVPMTHDGPDHTKPTLSLLTALVAMMWVRGIFPRCNDPALKHLPIHDLGIL